MHYTTNTTNHVFKIIIIHRSHDSVSHWFCLIYTNSNIKFIQDAFRIPSIKIVFSRSLERRSDVISCYSTSFVLLSFLHCSLKHGDGFRKNNTRRLFVKVFKIGLNKIHTVFNCFVKRNVIFFCFRKKDSYKTDRCVNMFFFAGLSPALPYSKVGVFWISVHSKGVWVVPVVNRTRTGNMVVKIIDFKTKLLKYWNYRQGNLVG